MATKGDTFRFATKLRQLADEAWELGEREAAHKLHDLARGLEEGADKPTDPPEDWITDTARTFLKVLERTVDDYYERNKRN